MTHPMLRSEISVVASRALKSEEGGGVLHFLISNTTCAGDALNMDLSFVTNHQR